MFGVFASRAWLGRYRSLSSTTCSLGLETWSRHDSFRPAHGHVSAASVQHLLTEVFLSFITNSHHISLRLRVFVLAHFNFGEILMTPRTLSVLKLYCQFSNGFLICQQTWTKVWTGWCEFRRVCWPCIQPYICASAARILTWNIQSPVKIDLQIWGLFLSLPLLQSRSPWSCTEEGLQYHVTVRWPSSGPVRLLQLSVRALDQWNTVGDRADHTHTPTKPTDWISYGRLDHCRGSHANGGGNFSPLSEIWFVLRALVTFS